MSPYSNRVSDDPERDRVQQELEMRAIQEILADRERRMNAIKNAARQRELARRRATHRRPLSSRDGMVAVLLVTVWFLMAAADTYAGNLVVIVMLWVGQALALRWLWRQYREHTAPSMLDKPRPATKPDIPLLVRLILLPGVRHWAGPMLASKARGIAFVRKDRWERAQQARHPAEVVSDWATYRNPDGTTCPVCLAYRRERHRTAHVHVVPSDDPVLR
jgi:hypothetical protein